MQEQKVTKAATVCDLFPYKHVFTIICMSTFQFMFLCTKHATEKEMFRHDKWPKGL